MRRPLPPPPQPALLFFNKIASAKLPPLRSCSARHCARPFLPILLLLQCPCAHPYAGLSLSTQNRLVCGVGREQQRQTERKREREREREWEEERGKGGGGENKCNAMKIVKNRKTKVFVLFICCCLFGSYVGRVSKWRPLVSVWVDATVVRPPAWLWLAASASGGV